ncbi:MAG: TolC family protein, partial [Chitinophagaceae bacterium]
MLKNRLNACLAILGFCLVFTACKVPAGTKATENKNVPSDFGTNNNGDTTNIADLKWRRFFTDQNLINLIDTAIVRNQELNITLQEIETANNDVLFRNGPLKPLVAARLGAGIEKVGRYTSQGAGDASTEIKPGKPVPEVIADYSPNIYASWEVDIWKKLRNSKKAAVSRYLASIEGKNFVLTNLVAEVANSYYELLALDNQLEIVKQNIALQQNALEVVKVQKQASKATELAVQKFQAEVLRTQSLEFDIVQDIKETENRINFLLARYPQDIPRDKAGFFGTVPAAVSSGLPSQLLANRPDIRQAELELAAAKLDVKVARAEFYPSLDITAMVGLQAFKPSYLVKLPESIFFLRYS